MLSSFLCYNKPNHGRNYENVSNREHIALFFKTQGIMIMIFMEIENRNWHKLLAFLKLTRIAVRWIVYAEYYRTAGLGIIGQDTSPTISNPTLENTTVYL